MLSFTSMGANVDYQLLCGGGGRYPFRIDGQCHHLIGPLLPKDGQRPKFSQLYIYIYNTEHESRNRIASLNNQGNTTTIDEVLLTELQYMLHQVNPYAMQF